MRGGDASNGVAFLALVETGRLGNIAEGIDQETRELVI
jgi:hypothetical protein